MLNRRTLITSSAVGAALASAPGRAARAALASGPSAQLHRGFEGVYERMPTLDLESHFDFLWGVQNYALTEHKAAADARADALLAAGNLSPEEDVPLERALALFGPDPVIAAQAKAMSASQTIKLRRLDQEFSSNVAHYRAELDEAQARRGDRLQLDPDLVVPEYGRHEIHNQPGGYVGNEFAGYIYRYGLPALYSGHGFQDEHQKQVAMTFPVPADERVERILELGCALGQLSTALKVRFPEAEVWGADSSAAMLRYANKRAYDIGIDINFKHTLGEALAFPDDHFDIVSTYIMLHEVSPDAVRGIVRHSARVLRPGGLFYPIDFYTASAPAMDAKSRYAAWLNARWDHEDWREAYATVDLRHEMQAAGLDVTGGPGAGDGLHNIVGVKRA
jgi:SAM-dependent methyltransferase